mmetsp:Transcript_25006/g.51371  ORF Transcript_25006/g.51371 Transcript_25006/m.51371 type:complete len:265 (-) Transcript_25006:279-1073(-)
MREELEKRLETTAEREALARELIRDELVELAKAGGVAALRSRLEALAEEAELEGGKRARGCAESRDCRGCTLLMLACEGNHAELAEFLLTHGRTIDEGNIYLEPGEESLAAKTFKCNVNARDAKGWNASAIACFRHKGQALRVLLANGGDAHAKNQYGKSAVDFAEDVLDAAEAVYQDNSPMRSILREFGVSKDNGPGISISVDGSGKESGGVPSEGTATMMNIEMNKEALAAAGGGGGGKKKGKAGGGAAGKSGKAKKGKGGK